MKGRLRVSALGSLVIATLLAALPPDAPIADAAMRGRIDEVRALVKRGEDVDAALGDGMTALHWAAERGDAALAGLLLEARAKVDPVTRLNGYTPLHLATRSGHGDVARALVAAGADVRASTATGATALHFAAAAGDAPSVALLLAGGAEVDARESAWDQTPLMFAAAYGRTAAVRVLMERGADPSATSRVLVLPERESVDRAANKRRNEVLEAFREEDGGDDNWRPNPLQVQAAIEAAQEVQRTLAAPAPVAEDQPEVAAGEEVAGYSGLVGTQGGLTPLLHAVREGHAATAAALLDGGADIDQPSAGDQTGPLLMATINGHFDLALDLVARGADPDLANSAGATPLFTAINTQWAPRSRYPQQHAYMLQKATYLDVMKALLEAGADPDVRLEKHLWFMSYTFDLLGVDTRGATAFWRAAYATDVPAMRLLLEYGADPTIPTVKPEPRRRRGGGGGGQRADPSGLAPIPAGGPGVYPIHAAAGVGYGEGYAGNAHRHVPEGWVPAIRFLVEELGADVNARDHNGYNAVHHAAARGDNALILYLVSRGADVTAVSRRGQTTADMANGPVQRITPFYQTVALLERLGSTNNHNCMSC